MERRTKQLFRLPSWKQESHRKTKLKLYIEARLKTSKHMDLPLPSREQAHGNQRLKSCYLCVWFMDAKVTMTNGELTNIWNSAMPNDLF